MLEICTPDTDCTVEFTILNSNEKRETTFTFSWSVFGPDLPQGSAGLHLPGPHSPGAAPAPAPAPRTGVAELRRAGEQRIGGAGALHLGGRGRGHGLQVPGGGGVVCPTLLGRRRAGILCCKTQADPALQ